MLCALCRRGQTWVLVLTISFRQEKEVVWGGVGMCKLFSSLDCIAHGALLLWRVLGFVFGDSDETVDRKEVDCVWWIGRSSCCMNSEEL